MFSAGVYCAKHVMRTDIPLEQTGLSSVAVQDALKPSLQKTFPKTPERIIIIIVHASCVAHAQKTALLPNPRNQYHANYARKNWQPKNAYRKMLRNKKAICSVCRNEKT